MNISCYYVTDGIMNWEQGSQSSHGERKVWVGLCCLMTSGLSKGQSVSCMTILFFLNLQHTRSDIRPHIKWAVSLTILYGHFNIPWGVVFVCMG